MRVPWKARALFAGTVAAGAGVLIAVPFERHSASVATLALLAAAVVLTELVQVSGDESSLDPTDSQSFSFSSGIHLAAALIIGPWTAAFVAAFGVVTVDSVRGKQFPRVAYNASVFAIAALAGGFAFKGLGGTPGHLALPADFLALGALALVYYGLNTLLVSAMIAFHSEDAILPLVRDSVGSQFLSAAGETGLGVAVAFFALSEPWAVIAVVPLVLAVYQAHARLATVRRETARALETFANVVDERDPYTYRHSERVAGYVQRLGEGLGLPAADVARLRWAGRLHDLGKIAVDASVLNKPSKLDPEEWRAMRRHARLSARLLRRFRLASEAARSVEYHHERFDGKGYYGVDSLRIPLASHFLVVADSYDAMTSDRPYRRALPRETALEEIEHGAGTQFHPAVAKAFAAQQRGLDPGAALSPEELAELRHVSLDRRRRTYLLVRELRSRREVSVTAGIVGGLIAVAFGSLPTAAVAFGLGLAALAWSLVEDARAARLAASLRSILEAGDSSDRFDGLVERIAALGELRWAGLVTWRESELAGSLEREWNTARGPNESALTSWLIREAEAGDIVVSDGDELGREGTYLALSLKRDGTTVGYFVLASYGSFARRLELALGIVREHLVDALVAPPEVVALPARKLAAAS